MYRLGRLVWARQMFLFVSCGLNEAHRMQRAYYNSTVEDFVSAGSQAILGELVSQHPLATDLEQRNAWMLLSVISSQSRLVQPGELVTLASAGTNPLDSHATDSLDKVWCAVVKNDFREALSLLTKLRADLQHSSLYWFAAGYLHSEMGN